MDLIDNIDEVSEKTVKSLNLTKSDFIDCLREVTRDKIFSIKESKTIFEKRVKKLIKAQDYEIKCQEAFALLAAQKIFNVQA
jgi:GMP synthase PP-ATPase subunit